MDTTQKMASQKRNALERIEGLEKMVPDLLQAIGKQLDEMKAKVEALEEMTDAVIGVVGVQPVSDAMTASRELRARQQAEAQKQETEKLVSDGVLELQDFVDEKSILVLKELKADGTEIPPGWFRVGVPELKPNLQSDVIGKAARSTVSMENGGSFEILEIYKVNASKAVANAQKES
jgi:hypothetical protein